MQPPPAIYSVPPGYRPAKKSNIVLIVLMVLAAIILVCCLGGAALSWRGGLSDVVACNQLTSSGEYKEAIPHCRAVVKRLPDSGAAHNELGWCLALDGQLSESVSECRTAVELEPNPAFYDSLAMALALSGKGDAALEIEKDQVMINGDVRNDAERVTLGMVYYSVGRRGDARKQWERARRGSNETARKLAAEFELKHP